MGGIIIEEQILGWQIECLFIFRFIKSYYFYIAKENVYNYVIPEYETNIETYEVFELLVNINLINSLKFIFFIEYSKVDFKFLKSLAECGGFNYMF